MKSQIFLEEKSLNLVNYTRRTWRVQIWHADETNVDFSMDEYNKLEAKSDVHVHWNGNTSVTESISFLLWLIPDPTDITTFRFDNHKL